MTKARKAAARRCLTTMLLALFALAWQGCAGTAVRDVPQARLQAIKHNQRGVDAGSKGNQDAALAEFTEALRLHSSIENWDGMVVARINIARTHRLKGDPASARRALERALLVLPQSTDLASELFFENAKVYLAAGDLAAAQDWALQAAAADKGSELGRRLNLVGAILFRAGSPEQAREKAEQALKLNRDRKVEAEEANSLRLLGEIHLAQGREGQAAESFEAALLLDKSLGLAKKIALDLRGLGAAALQKEDLPAATAYYGRALEVSRSIRDTASAAGDLAQLADLKRRSGDAPAAQKLDEERAKLTSEERKLSGPISARSSTGP